MKLPALVINFKTYPQSTGKSALALAQACDKIAKKTGAHIIIAVQAPDIYRIVQKVGIPVFAQHTDNINYGKNTGYLLPEAIKDAGATGTLLNHAEHKLPYPLLKDTIGRCRSLKLATLACAANTREATQVAQCSPNYIAVEPPELIGTGVSVATAEPQAVTSSIAAVHRVKKIPVLCGAGITNAEDIRKALELGTNGVLLASSVTLAKNPAAILKELANAMVNRRER